MSASVTTQNDPVIDATHPVHRNASRRGDRPLEPERMDQPDLDPKLLQHALADLDRLNALGRTAARLAAGVRRLVDRTDCRRGDRLVVLDCGSGGGGVTRALASRLAMDGRLAAMGVRRVRVVGVDATETSVERAKRAARGWRVPTRARGPGVDLSFRYGCVPQDTWPETPDIVVSSLFLHHLDDVTLAAFLTQCSMSARVGVTMEDLRPGRLAELGVGAAVRVCSRCPVVHEDGPRSVRNAVDPRTLESMARAAGLDGATVAPVRPFRSRLEWIRRCD